MYFCSDKRESLKGESLKATDVMKKLAAMWKELDSESKKKYAQQAELDKARYLEEKKQYELKNK
uniref:HMG box domain-containing protein n=1 Tax=Arcella intermedia TaxID=1963864 RepID=A0A6B2LVA9_9EUKA